MSLEIDDETQALLDRARAAEITAIFITWATVQDSRHTSAVTRAIGAAPHQLVEGGPDRERVLSTATRGQDSAVLARSAS
jgi:hypothetical protein